MTRTEQGRLSRVLVVDDHPGQRRTIADLLEAEGFEVTACGTGAAALEILQRQDIGVAVVDQQLPDLNGIQLLERLRSGERPMHVIIHTAYGAYESAKDAVNLGAFAYLEKAGNPDELVHHVQRAVRAGLVRYSAELETAVAARSVKLEESESALRQRLDQLDVLYRLATALQEAVTIEALYAAALDGLLRGLRVDRAAILLFDPDGVMRFKAWRGLSDAYRQAVEGHSPWTPDTQNPQPICVPDAAADDTLGLLRDVLFGEGIRALSFFPLVSEGRLLGKVMVYCNRPRRPTEEELRLAQTIVRHIAFAVERKRAEEEQGRAQAFLQSIVENIPDMIVVKDARNFRFIRFNRAGEELLGYSRDELIGKTVYDVLPEHEADSLYAADLDVLTTKRLLDVPEHQVETRHRGARVLHTKKIPVLDTGGQPQYLLSISEDITDRKRAETAARRSEQELRKVLDERERLSQDLHDGILQSLYAIGLGLEACKSFQRHRKKAADALDQALDRAVGQLNAVMRDVRNFIAGLDSDMMQTGDLSMALRTMIASIGQPHDARFKVAVDRAAVTLLSREQSLHLFNVVKEAVSNSLRHAQATQATVALRTLKHGVRLTIRDNGVGFDPQAVVGVGRGLTNMAARAQKIGGKCSVQSKLKGGTRVTVDVPKEVLHAHAEDQDHPLAARGRP